MKETFIEFENRKKEINSYFDLLRIFDNDHCFIYWKDNLYPSEEDKKTSIEPDLFKILKANSFLLLYNLIESTIRKSIEDIYDEMHKVKVSYRNINDKIKKIWFLQNRDYLNNIEKLMPLVQRILDEELITFQPNKIKFGGTLDAQKIRELSEEIGVETVKNGRHLLTIKNKRNNLAHGIFSFTEIGKDHTYKELLDFKESTIKYLNDVLNNFSTFIDNNAFFNK